jgi:hypothetical protein
MKHRKIGREGRDVLMRNRKQEEMYFDCISFVFYFVGFSFRSVLYRRVQCLL